jgi:hypothetical protein
MIEDMTVRKLGAALGVAYGAGLRVSSPTTRDKKRLLSKVHGSVLQGCTRQPKSIEIALRLLETKDLFMNQSALTGEASVMPVRAGHATHYNIAERNQVHPPAAIESNNTR